MINYTSQVANCQKTNDNRQMLLSNNWVRNRLSVERSSIQYEEYRRPKLRNKRRNLHVFSSEKSKISLRSAFRLSEKLRKVVSQIPPLRYNLRHYLASD